MSGRMNGHMNGRTTDDRSNARPGAPPNGRAKRPHMRWAAAVTAALLGVALAAPAQAKSPIWIDVRTPHEHAQGHVPQSLNIPYDEIEQHIAAAAPDKNTPIALYCRSGRRSEIARQTLLQLGYTQVQNLGSYDSLR